MITGHNLVAYAQVRFWNIIGIDKKAIDQGFTLGQSFFRVSSNLHL